MTDVSPLLREHFRHSFLLPAAGEIPLMPVVYPVHVDGNHFIAVVQDTERRRVYVIGRTDTGQHDAHAYWKSDAVNGYARMQTVCHLHDWHCPDLDEVEVHDVRTRQNGYDCGIVVMDAAMGLFRDGLNVDVRGQLSIRTATCSHARRLEVFEVLSSTVRLLAERYRLCRDLPPP